MVTKKVTIGVGYDDRLAGEGLDDLHAHTVSEIQRLLTAGMAAAKAEGTGVTGWSILGDLEVARLSGSLRQRAQTLLEAARRWRDEPGADADLLALIEAALGSDNVWGPRMERAYQEGRSDSAHPAGESSGIVTGEGEVYTITREPTLFETGLVELQKKLDVYRDDNTEEADGRDTTILVRHLDMLYDALEAVHDILSCSSRQGGV